MAETFVARVISSNIDSFKFISKYFKDFNIP